MFILLAIVAIFFKISQSNTTKHDYCTKLVRLLFICAITV